MRFKILKMLCQNHNIRPVGYPEIIAELYYDLDYIKDEPDSQSYKVVIYLLRKQLRSAIGDKLLITAHKGRGLMIELNELYREGYE
jgi:DNA-binding response OmpR family regulator